MIPTYKKRYKDGDLQIGWASWDKDSATGKHRYQYRSIKYSYPSKNGHISRGAPEIPFDVALDMVTLAAQQGELNGYVAEVKAAYDALGAVVDKMASTDTTARVGNVKKDLGVTSND